MRCWTLSKLDFGMASAAPTAQRSPLLQVHVAATALREAGEQVRRCRIVSVPLCSLARRFDKGRQVPNMRGNHNQNKVVHDHDHTGPNSKL